MPLITPVVTSMIKAMVKILFAVWWFFLPCSTAITAEAPTPIRSATAKQRITSGMAMVTAPKDS